MMRWIFLLLLIFYSALALSSIKREFIRLNDNLDKAIMAAERINAKIDGRTE